MTKIPRRARMDLWCKAELSIYNAVQDVERLGADVRLTEAVNTLQKARDLVADYIDNLPVYTVRYSNPQCGWKGEATYITLNAREEQHAMDIAMLNPEFCKHIDMRYYDRKYLCAFVPITNIDELNRVRYFEGDERL